jgi:hypothetical protein
MIRSQILYHFRVPHQQERDHPDYHFCLAVGEAVGFGVRLTAANNDQHAGNEILP